jgi:hypothetical protein
MPPHPENKETTVNLCFMVFADTTVSGNRRGMITGSILLSTKTLVVEFKAQAFVLLIR